MFLPIGPPIECLTHSSGNTNVLNIDGSFQSIAANVDNGRYLVGKFSSRFNFLPVVIIKITLEGATSSCMAYSICRYGCHRVSVFFKTENLRSSIF
jgi:hypothetical protein